MAMYPGTPIKSIPKRHRAILEVLGSSRERRDYVLKNLNKLAPIQHAKPEDFANWYDRDAGTLAWGTRLIDYVTLGGHDYDEWDANRNG